MTMTWRSHPSNSARTRGLPSGWGFPGLRLPSWVTVSVACGALFLLGNLLLLYAGDSTFYAALPEEPVLHHGKGQQWSVGNRIERTLQRRRIELPAAVLVGAGVAAEITRSRRLMAGDERGAAGDVVVKQADSAHHQPLSASPHAAPAVLSVTPDELRQRLAATANCPLVAGISSLEHVASGWTKAVYKGKMQDPLSSSAPLFVAVKTVAPSGFDVQHCVTELGLAPTECHDRAGAKLMKEITLLAGMSNKHVVQVLAHCVPPAARSHDDAGSHGDQVAVVTELGDTVDLISLLTMSWEDRLRIVLGLSRLLAYLASSPFGSVVLNDFRRQQFVLVGGDVKLTDVDDMGFQEMPCASDRDCQQYFSAANFTLSVSCVLGECRGLNEKKNVFNTARHFTTLLLPPGAPGTLTGIITGIVYDFGNATSSARELKMRLEHLTELYTSGQYLHRPTGESAKHLTAYEVVPSADFPGEFDYACRYSVSGGVGCTVSVFDQKEAEDLCDHEPDCKAAVLAHNTRTWTGRLLAHLKNDIGTAVTNSNTTLLIKPQEL